MADPERLKGYVAFVRELIIVIMLALLLVIPGWMNDRLEQAGFVKLSVAGSEWEALRDSEETVKNATENTVRLEQRLQDLTEKLNAIGRSQSAAPEVKRQITALSQEVEQTQSETRTVRANLGRSLALQQSVIERVQPKMPVKARPVPRQP
ncbi:MAG: hypothetical protein ACE145_02105 [Terriglobia bacterium]